MTAYYHSNFPNELRQKLLEWIIPLEKELKKLEIPLDDKAELEIKTKRFYAEQSFIVRQEILQKGLKEHLTAINQLLTLPGKPSSRCYISYAWPSKENEESEYWVQPFLLALYEHLKVSGIQAIMDIQDNKPGDSIYQFMQQYHEGNYIILVGTESLLQKHYSITPHAVKTELSIISERFEQDQKRFGQSRIYPFLISGTLKTAYPEIYDEYHTVEDGREPGYLGALKRLIDWIYEQQINQSKLRYEELWQTFYKNQPELPKDLKSVEQELNFGYHKKRLDYLKQDVQYQSIQAQEEAKYSSAVSAKVIGVLIESIGSSSKTLFDEHGQQFQRPYSNPDFIEREVLWDKMTAHFAQKEQQILTLTAHGLGGMGKTELAGYYYLHPLRPYTLRAWFHAVTREQLYVQYIQLASDNGIKFADEMPIEQRARRIKKWLEGQKDCLLVYDNVPDAKTVEGLLPEQGKHHILMTSRNEVDWPQHQKLDVDIMEEQEAIALIVKITGRQESAEKLKLLVNTLGRLPLALAQAGAYMAVKSLTIEDYLKLYQQYQARLLSDKTSRSPKHEPVWITFDMNFDALNKECPAALMTLKQASWLSHTAIPEVLLQMLLCGTNNTNTKLLWGDIKEQLKRYSFVHIDIERQQLSMHSLLKDILRSRQKETEQIEIFKEVCDTIDILFSYYHEKGSFEYKNLLSHMESLYQHGQFIAQLPKINAVIEKPILLTARPMFLGLACLEAGLIQNALKFQAHQLVVYEQHYGKDDPIVAYNLVHLGGIYQDLGNPNESKELHERALRILKTHDSKVDPKVLAKIYCNLGNAYASLGDLDKKKELLELALDTLKPYYKDEYPEIINILASLGSTYKSLGDINKGKALLEFTLPFLEIYHGKDHPRVGEILNNLGVVYLDLGDNKKSEELLVRALAIQEIYFGKEHIVVAQTLMNLGISYYGLRKMKKSKDLLERALAIREIHYGKNHYEVAQILLNLSNVYVDLADLERSKSYLERALPIFEIHYGINHIEVSRTLAALGSVYCDLGDKFKSKEFLERALFIFNAHYSGSHVEVGKTLALLGSTYLELNEISEGKKLLIYSLNILENWYKKDTIEMVAILKNLAKADALLDKFTDMETYLKRIRMICQQYCPENLSNIEKAIKMLPTITSETQQISITGMDSADELNTDLKMELYEQGMQLYQAKKYDDALNFFNKVLFIQQKNGNLIDQITAAVYINRGIIFLLKEDFQQAYLSFQYAYEIRLKLLGPSHYATKKAQERLQQCRDKLKESDVQSFDLQKLKMSNYSLDNKIPIEDTSLIQFLKEVTQLPFYGVRDESYKVDAIVEIHTETEARKVDTVHRDLEDQGLFFQYCSKGQTKRGFVLEGINLPEGQPTAGQKIKAYLLQQSKLT